MKVLGVILLSILAFCSASQSETEEYTETEITLEDTASRIEVLWDSLVNQQGGCLVGGQYARDGKFQSRRCVFEFNLDWNTFYSSDTSELKEFLLNRLSDISKSHIHTCPFFVATEGEVATYVLQRLSGKNWFELNGFTEYEEKIGSGSTENHQVWLQRILEDPVQQVKMKEEWERLPMRNYFITLNLGQRGGAR